jgi:hypothetical protein
MTAGTLVLALAFFGLLPPPQAPAGNGDAATLTATSTNVAEPGSPVRIRIFRWSTDEERNPFLTALNPPARGAGPGAGERGGAARGGRAAAPARGRARGPAAPLTPAAALAAAAGRSPTIGYVWTNDITGYSIKYAYRAPQPDGGERIVLLTDRRLGAHSAAWKPATSGAETDYEFTVLEIRMDAKGVGEGKTSLMTRVVAENEAKTVALENYAATATILQNVKR